MKQINFLVLLLPILLYSCNNIESTTNDETSTEDLQTDESISKAEEIIKQTIAVHGGTKYDAAKIEFNFRGRHYISDRQGSNYQYERIFEENGATIRDILNNNGFTREKDGAIVNLSAKKKKSYSNSVNSVIYFALLPYYLNDGAVNLKYLGETTFQDKQYHKIMVTFDQEGGGKDHEDEYVYWINKENHTIDFLAYNYLVDGGGARMREAYNIRTVKGIRFADYINYKPTNGSKAVAKFDQLYEDGKMKELSRIESEDVEVQLGEGK